MSQENREAERQRVLAMIAIEEEYGPVVSGGPARSADARARQPAQGRPSGAVRARGSVRFLARAVPSLENQAA